MSSFFDSAIQMDSAALCSADGEFAESVTYTKRNGTTRAIYAIIERDPPTKDDDPRLTQPKMICRVQNSVTLGVLISELDSGDTITVAYRKGDSATSQAWSARLLDERMNHNSGWVYLRLD